MNISGTPVPIWAIIGVLSALCFLGVLASAAFGFYRTRHPAFLVMLLYLPLAWFRHTPLFHHVVDAFALWSQIPFPSWWVRTAVAQIEGFLLLIAVAWLALRPPSRPSVANPSPPGP